jgi:hypothetical protein
MEFHCKVKHVNFLTLGELVPGELICLISQILCMIFIFSALWGVAYGGFAYRRFRPI